MLIALIALSVFILAALALSVLDSYLRRGLRLTFNFFFFAFLYILSWSWKDMCPILFSLMPAGRLRHANELLFLARERYSIVFIWIVFVIIIAGWMFLFYFGWFIAEKMLQRFDVLKKRLFLTLLLSSLVISAVLYPVVKIINIVNWQKWRIIIISNDIFLIGHTTYSFVGRFFFSTYFLAAYFLIECSKWRHKNWKMIFFLLPFIHLWTIRLSGGGSAVFFERMAVFAAVVILAFLNRSRLIDIKYRETV